MDQLAFSGILFNSTKSLNEFLYKVFVSDRLKTVIEEAGLTEIEFSNEI